MKEATYVVNIKPLLKQKFKIEKEMKNQRSKLKSVTDQIKSLNSWLIQEN